MQMGKGHVLHGGDIRSNCCFKNIFSCSFGVVFGCDKVGFCQNGGFIDYIGVRNSRFGFDDLLGNQTEKTLCSGIHVIGCIVGVCESIAEKFMVEFGKGGPFEFPTFTSGNGAKIRGQVFGVQFGHIPEQHGQLFSEILRSNYPDIEADVVAHQVFGFGYILMENAQHFLKVVAFFKGSCSGDTVDFFCIIGDGESLWLDNIIMVG